MFEHFGYYFNGSKRFTDTDDALSKKERMLLEWCNYLLDNTKFKNIVLNHFENITFESSNRTFKLEINDDYTFSLSYYYKKLTLVNGRDYSTPDDIYESTIKGDFYKLRNWFKKRNYLK